MIAIFRPNSKSCRFGLVVFAFLICAWSARGASLTDYRLRVSHAAETLERLQASYTDEDSLSRDNFADDTIARVLEQLPAQETVVLGTQNVAVDNTWLHDALSEFRKINGNRTMSAASIGRIVERLRALIERIDEMKEAAGAAKDDNKARLAEILRRPEYNHEPAEGSAMERVATRILNWLARLLRSLFPRSKPMQAGSSRGISRIAQLLVLAIGLGLAAFLIWKFLPGLVRGRRKKKKKREARIVLGERLEPDQTAADLLAQAEQLARSGDLRAAIRKAYIALLCELGDRKVISLAQYKTNRDYLNAVRGKAPLHSVMHRLTNSFELHWYGFVPAAEGDWSEFRTGCRDALNTGSV
jgi:hypothetical protein